MFKIPSKLSIWLSLTLCVVFFLICLGSLFIMPELTEILILAREPLPSVFDYTADHAQTIILVLIHLTIGLAMFADGLLFRLLLRVRKGKVFTSKSVALIREVSWSCFLIGLIVFVLGLYFLILLALAFIALFLSLCLRVVKNVIEEATRIKSENDLTV